MSTLQNNQITECIDYQFGIFHSSYVTCVLLNPVVSVIYIVDTPATIKIHIMPSLLGPS